MSRIQLAGKRGGFVALGIDHVDGRFVTAYSKDGRVNYDGSQLSQREAIAASQKYLGRKAERDTVLDAWALDLDPAAPSWAAQYLGHPARRRNVPSTTAQSMKANGLATTGLVCVNDRYCPQADVFTSLADFQAMCEYAFGERAILTRRGNDYIDELGEVVLRPVEDIRVQRRRSRSTTRHASTSRALGPVGPR